MIGHGVEDQISKRNLRITLSIRLVRSTILLLCMALGIAACGSSHQAANVDDTEMFRDPHPTFTPIAIDENASQAPKLSEPANASTAPLAPAPLQPGVPEGAELEPARAIVNAPLVNLRSGPSLNTDIVASVERGSEFDLVGRSNDLDWWEVCCYEGKSIWIAGDYVDTDGAVDSIPTTDALPAPVESAGTNTAQSEAPLQGLGGSAGQTRFELITMEQFPESNLVRIYLYLYEDSNALAGYRARIVKDGREIPVTTQSFGGQPAFTWPFQDARQRFQNLKIELPDESPAGNWTIQPLDSEGRPVGPSAEFTLRENDPNQELYVRYERHE